MHHLEAIEQVVHTISKCDFEYLTTRVVFIEISVTKESIHSQQKWLSISKSGTCHGESVPYFNKIYLEKGLIFITLTVNPFFSMINSLWIMDKH